MNMRDRKPKPKEDQSEEAIVELKPPKTSKPKSSKSHLKKRKADDEKLINSSSSSASITQIDAKPLTNTSKSKRSKRKEKKLTKKAEMDVDSDESVCLEIDQEEENEDELVNTGEVLELKPVKTVQRKGKSRSLIYSNSKNKMKRTVIDTNCKLHGEPIPVNEARLKWPHRYEDKVKDNNSASTSSKKVNDEEEEVLVVRRHYQQAVLDNIIYKLGDDVFIQGDTGGEDYIGRIVEFFETTDKRAFFTARWFFRAEDTVIAEKNASLVDEKRLFYSEYKNDNPLDCITSKIKIVEVSPDVDLVAKKQTIPSCDFYYDMEYSMTYSTFSNLKPESSGTSSNAVSDVPMSKNGSFKKASLNSNAKNSNMKLLDLYAGCGGMSTGLCLGAAVSGVNLSPSWAVDFNKYACQSLRENHPTSQVRNETAENFLMVLKEWLKLCTKFSLLGTSCEETLVTNDEDDVGDDDAPTPSGVFEVAKLLEITYGDPNNIKEIGLYFKVQWKGYGPEEDTWEPISGLMDCEERVREFVTRGYHENILPLPGDVDVICGGPPCQGISGFNRFRNKVEPLQDEKNHQVVVFMDIVEFLKPRYVLMENVVDLLKFSKGFLGRYAIGRLVSLDYQARLGLMAAGSYGVPQFRMRVFLWGALPTEVLPSYPLPSHEVVQRGVVPLEFEQNTVACDSDHRRHLKDALILSDAIRDLPPVTNDESRDQIPYVQAAETDLQKLLRSCKQKLMGIIASEEPSPMLYDHLPYRLNKDDFERVSRVPKKKGANFRDLGGLVIHDDNRVELAKGVEREKLSSGKFVVPDYAISWKKGYSTEPFGRVWWDETVSTVVTRAQPHNRVITHPEQDRVLTVRENARIQGFPDYYKLSGPVKERYIQVGNAVSVPVARALGHALAVAHQRSGSSDPLIKLPLDF
ncbi:DNA (cytosine-5)-methyltransferase [Thalictrum thalictroides]|uniref:Cytosine-specific methyltransferase n=1 Tax=Thalictrum thalictroides TaxID=46969 RepID=A0A7J6V2B6_THATH|nr:DNA (cytosine-5)-methyltransferase [Thalictrum thalictroides]